MSYQFSVPDVRKLQEVWGEMELNGKFISVQLHFEVHAKFPYHVLSMNFLKVHLCHFIYALSNTESVLNLKDNSKCNSLSKKGQVFVSILSNVFAEQQCTRESERWQATITVGQTPQPHSFLGSLQLCLTNPT